MNQWGKNRKEWLKVRRFKTIKLTNHSKHKLLYDFNTKRYYIIGYRNKGSNTIALATLFITQAILLIAIEFAGNVISEITGANYQPMANILLFISACIVITLITEFWYSWYGQQIRHCAVRTTERQARYVTKNILARRLEVIFNCTLITVIFLTILVCFAILTDVFLLWILAGIIYMVLYFLIAGARPLLLYRYMKEVKPRVK